MLLAITPGPGLLLFRLSADDLDLEPEPADLEGCELTVGTDG